MAAERALGEKNAMLGMGVLVIFVVRSVSSEWGEETRQQKLLVSTRSEKVRAKKGELV